MRLAQLARKVSVKPSDIVEFLASKAIAIENTSNAKVNDEYVELVLKHFAPELQRVDEEVQEEPHVISGHVQDLDIGIEKIEVRDSPLLPEIADKDQVELEVIKPPKVELPGLKVVGKIELPEPKKKETESEPGEEEGGGQIAEGAVAEEQPRRKSREENRRKVRPLREQDIKPRKNPIALQREREEHEALRRKLEQKEIEKELRTQRYLKKVSGKTAVPKPVKHSKHDEEYEVYSEESKPKTLIGKILSWFVSD